MTNNIKTFLLHGSVVFYNVIIKTNDNCLYKKVYNIQFIIMSFY